MKKLLILLLSVMIIISAIPSALAIESSDISDNANSLSDVNETPESSESYASSETNSSEDSASSESSTTDPTDDTNAPAETPSGSYTAYMRMNSAGRWFAWTWGQGEDRWVTGHPDGTYYKFENLDCNVVFACVDWYTVSASWDNGSVIKQTVDIQLDNVNKEFVFSDENSEGKITGYLASFDESVWGANIPTQPSAPSESVDWEKTDPTAPSSDKNPTNPTQKPSSDNTKPTSSSGGGKTINDNSNAKTVSPKLNLKTATVKCGKVITLKVSNKGSKTVKYSSSNKKVAKVSSKGKVSALKRGFAKITAKVGSKKLYFTIKVTSSPKLSKSSVSVKKDKTVTVKITGKCSTVKNTYTNTKKAKIISKRTASKIKIKGLKKGKTTLKIKVNVVTLKLKVKIK